MKKILSVFLALMISAFLLASCGASPSSNSVSGTRFNGDYEIASHENVVYHDVDSHQSLLNIMPSIDKKIMNA